MHVGAHHTSRHADHNPGYTCMFCALEGYGAITQTVIAAHATKLYCTHHSCTLRTHLHGYSALVECSDLPIPAVSVSVSAAVSVSVPAVIAAAAPGWPEAPPAPAAPALEARHVGALAHHLLFARAPAAAQHQHQHQQAVLNKTTKRPQRRLSALLGPDGTFVCLRKTCCSQHASSVHPNKVHVHWLLLLWWSLHSSGQCSGSTCMAALLHTTYNNQAAAKGPGKSLCTSSCVLLH